jgi:hypothetical protein
MSRPIPSRGPALFTWPWLALLLGCVALVVGVETTLLGLTTSFLTSGYNAARVDSPLTLLAFLSASATLDLALLLGLWLLVVPAAARLGAGRLQVLCAAALAAIAIPLGLTAFRYNLHAILGEMASPMLIRQFSRLDSWGVVETTLHEMPVAALALLAALVAAGSLLAAMGRVERRFPDLADPLRAPSARVLGAAFALFSAVGAVLLGIAPTRAEAFSFGLERKTSGILLTWFVEEVSDLDRDHFGALSQPPDAAPLDASIHPYAVDVPGNGIDENGLAGDHPAARADASPVETHPAPGGQRPHLLLVYLESFRADLLGQRHDGVEITPFLNRLAAEGSASANAFCHSPWTMDSRAQLFSGRIRSRPGETTLVDDFRARGYTVLHFSGQDDSYGDIRLLGAERADVFYDARQDVARRTSRSTAPVSLQVSWKTLLERVSAALERTDPARPIFLYANVVDTHYPYSHAELDPILSQTPLDRAEIRADNADRVREGYANAAANVDRAVERIVAAFRRRIAGADHAILVTADHGQSLYDEGLLGHGQSVERAQTQVPFILWGIGGEWPEPVVPTDVRPLLLANLGRERGATAPRARFVPDPDRAVLQYYSALERPMQIALRRLERVARYDFRLDRLDLLGPDGRLLHTTEGQRTQAFLEAIRRWEEVQYAALTAPPPTVGLVAAGAPDR